MARRNCTRPPRAPRSNHSGDESPHSILAASSPGDHAPMKETVWPHAPMHRLAAAGTYIVTAGTYRKLHHFRDPERLGVLQRGLLKLAAAAGWQIEAWAVFSNHYHFIAHSPAAGAESLPAMLKELHGSTSHWINSLDAAPGRQVWHNYWDTRLTYERAYLARLNYVHQNAVHHALVPVANQYPWCSAAWFERTATPAQVNTIYTFKTDRVKVFDDWTVERG